MILLGLIFIWQKYTNRPCLYYAYDATTDNYEMGDALDTCSLYIASYFEKTGEYKESGVRKLLGIESDKYKNSHDSLEDVKEIAHEYVNWRNMRK